MGVILDEVRYTVQKGKNILLEHIKLWSTLQHFKAISLNVFDMKEERTFAEYNFFQQACGLNFAKKKIEGIAQS